MYIEMCISPSINSMLLSGVWKSEGYLLKHHQPRCSCLSSRCWCSHTADKTLTQQSAAAQCMSTCDTNTWVLHGLRLFGQAHGKTACKDETEAQKDRVLLPTMGNPHTQLKSHSKHILPSVGGHLCLHSGGFSTQIFLWRKDS